MGQITWRSVSRNWSVLFSAAVALWFLISAINVPSLDISNPFGDTRPETSAPTSISATTSIEVRSFHVEVGPPVTAEMTLRVRNDSDSRMTFQPDSLVLSQTGGRSNTPIAAVTPPVEVAGGRSVLVPVSFPARVAAGGEYNLTYAGEPVFTGRPISV